MKSVTPGRLLAALPALCVSAAVLAMAVVKMVQGPYPGWDTYAFLCNAMEMAGRSVGYVEPARPPLLSFLTALVVRTGVVSEYSILIADVALSALGVVALYLLLARRFPRWIAAAGAVLLIGLPPFWVIVGTGMSDFGSVALAICAVLCTVKATEDDPRWYLLAFPLWVAAFLMRFGALLVLIPMIVWLVQRARPFRQAKYIVGGAIAASIAYLPAGLWFLNKASDFAWPLQIVQQVSAGDFGVGGQVGTAAGAVANTRVIPGQWYLENIHLLVFPKSMGALSIMLLVVAAFGLLAAAAAALAPARVRWRSIPAVAATALAVGAQASSSTAVRLVTILVLGLTVAWATRPRPGDADRAEDDDYRWALDATVLTWGLVFFDAQGHLAFQLDRYFLTMAPAVIYFVLVGWRSFSSLLVRSLTLKPPRLHEADTPAGARRANVIATVSLVLVAGVTLGQTLAAPPPKTDPYVTETAATARWLHANVKDIKNKTVVSDAWPYMSYYLGQSVLPMLPFPDQKAWQWELEKRRADVYVSIHDVPRAGYEVAYENGWTTVWLRRAPFRTGTPRVAYLGRGWDTYLEIVGGYDFDLIFSALNVAEYHDVWRLDRFSAQELAAYDAVAIYGASWQDRGKAERELSRYVEDGGVLVVDASHNMAGLQNNLADTVFLGTLITRAAVPRDARITVEGGLTRASGSTEPVDAAPFATESGDPWFGAEYAPMRPGTQLQVLARLNGRPVVQLQRMGRGRIYWIGANLVWHAFVNEGNPESTARVPGSPESDLVRGVLRAAVGLAPGSRTTSGTVATP